MFVCACLVVCWLFCQARISAGLGSSQLLCMCILLVCHVFVCVLCSLFVTVISFSCLPARLWMEVALCLIGVSHKSGMLMGVWVGGV